MVGFQTKMTYGEQQRVFRTIPALESAEFFRLGSLHRNTFIKSPVLLDSYLRFKAEPSIFFAGQMIGVEGYVESAASGLMAGRFLAATVNNQALTLPPETTAHGSLLSYVSGSLPDNFQPMNINFGLLPLGAKRDGKRRLGKAERRLAVSERALHDLQAFLNYSMI